MNEREVRQIIEETVGATVAGLKATGLLKNDRRTAKEKTEELLRQYPFFKKVKGKRRTERIVESIEAALRSIGEDPYCDIIRRFYFENESREKIAESLCISPTTVSRNKARLIGELAPRLFSDEVITELFFE